MIRPIVLIAAAIQLSQPNMSDKTAKTYAKVIQEEAKKRHFDPFSIVAIIHKESWWVPSAISPSGRDFGLAQIRVEHLGACRKDADPVNDPSPACRALKASFLNPIFNIRYASAHITRSREFCRKKVGKVTYHGWLSAWQGTHKKGKWCRKNKYTTSRIKYRRKLVNLANRGRLKMKGNK
jgi:hypothetical protein